MAQRDNYIGIAMGLDVTDLKAGLNETKKAIDQANTKFKSATAGMDDWANSSEGVRESLEFLNTKLVNQKKNIAGYQAEIEELTEKYGANSAQVEKLTKKLASEQKALAKTETEIRQQTAQLNLLEGAYVDTITDAGQLEAGLKKLNTIMGKQKTTVAQYEQQLARAKAEHGETSNEVKELTNKLNKAKSAVEKTENAHQAYANQLNKVQSETKETVTDTKKLTTSLKNADSATTQLKGGFTVLKGAIAGLVTTGITSLISGLKSAVEESREFRREMGYLAETANSTGSDFDYVKDQLRDVTAITDDQEAAIEGLNNLMSAGFKSDTLDEITDQLVGASIKWKDTLKFEGLADGLQETLATGNAVGPFAELLERAGLNLEEFDAGLADATTSADKQNYVLKTLSRLGLSEIKKGYEENNKTLIEANKASFDYAEAQARLGERVEPVLTTVKMGFVDVLNSFLDMTAGIDGAGLQESIKGAFQWFIDNALPAIKEGIQWIIDNWSIVKAGILAVGAAFLTWKAAQIVSDVTKAVKELDLSLVKNIATFTKDTAVKIANTTATTANTVANKASTTARNLLNGTLIKNVVQWGKDTAAKVANTVATTAQTAATNGATLAQKLLNLAMKANPILLVVSLIMVLVTAFVTLWNKSEAFRNFWIGLWEKIKAVAKAVVDWLVKAFTTTWEAIKKVWSVVVGFFTGIWNGIKNVFSVVATWFTNLFQKAWNGIKNIWNAVVGFFTGIWDGIKNAFSAVATWFKEKFQAAWTNIKNIWNAVVGFFTGIWNGIKNVFSSVASTLGGFFSKAWSNIKNAFSSVGSFFSDIVSKIIGFFKELPNKMLNIGKDMMNGLINGVKSMVSNVKNAVKSAVDSAISGVKNFLGIHSPSTLMRDEIGKMMGEGVGVGLLASTKDVLKDAQKFSGQISKGMSAKMSDINAGLNGTVGSLKSASVGQSVTNVTNNYTQTINAPKSPSRIELYRQTKNLLSYKGAY